MKSLQGYATEVWVLRQLSKLPKSEVKKIEGQTGVPLSELLSKFFEEKDDPNNPGEKIYIAKQAKYADMVDKIHILPKEGEPTEGDILNYEKKNGKLQVVKATEADKADMVDKIHILPKGGEPTEGDVLNYEKKNGKLQVVKATEADKADMVDKIHILPKSGEPTEGDVLNYEKKNGKLQVVKATEAEKATSADDADKVDGIHINYGFTKETYKSLVDAGLDDKNTLYLIKR